MNTNLIYNKQSGRILRLERSATPTVLLNELEVLLPYPYEEGISKLDSHYVDIGTKELIPYPTKPSEYHRFNYTTKQWEDPRSLQELKIARWQSIKQQRTSAENASFIWDGSLFDSDPSSQARITTAIALASTATQLNQPYEVTWTLSDRTFRTLSAADMLQVGLAMGIHIQGIFNRGQALQAQIDSATTKEEVEAITW